MPSKPRLKQIVGSALLAAMLLVCSPRARGGDAIPAMVELDPAATRVAFTLQTTWHTVEGGFDLKRGSLTLDPATGKAEGLIVVDAASGKSGNGNRDAAMREDVLESSLYPEIRFTPQRFEQLDSTTDEVHLAVHGMLALHGADHEVTLPVVARTVGDRVTFTTRFPVPYVDWGLKDPSLLIARVAKEVAIEVSGVGRIARGTGAVPTQPDARAEGDSRSVGGQP
jgi:polyisoprenoid-binding protein YceI